MHVQLIDWENVSIERYILSSSDFPVHESPQPAGSGSLNIKPSPNVVTIRAAPRKEQSNKAKWRILFCWHLFVRLIAKTLSLG